MPILSENEVNNEMLKQIMRFFISNNGSYMSWPPVFTGIGFAFLADLILKSGNYQSSGKTVIAYTVFSVWLMGMLLPMYIMRESYFADMVPTYGQEYADKLMSYTPAWSFFLLTLLAIIGGLFGALIGKSVLKKHFKKAGII